MFRNDGGQQPTATPGTAQAGATPTAGRARSHRRGLAAAALALGALLLAGCGSGTATAESSETSSTTSTEDLATTYAARCADDDMAGCDMLTYYAEEGTADMELAETCNGKGDRETSGDCATLAQDLAKSLKYGDDTELDALYDTCGTGDLAACDQLYFAAPIPIALDSEYRDFAASCGGTQPENEFGGMCVENAAA